MSGGSELMADGQHQKKAGNHQASENPNNPTIKVLIADSHAITRFGLASLINLWLEGQCLLLEAGSLDEINLSVQSNQDISLLLLDLKLPGIQATNALNDLIQSNPDIPIVVMSSEEDEFSLKAIQLGAKGVILKNMPSSTLKNAIQILLDGEYFITRNTMAGVLRRNVSRASNKKTIKKILAQGPQTGALPQALSDRQIDVLLLISRGYGNREISDLLQVKLGTVKNHVAGILQRLGASTRSKAIIRARELGLLPNSGNLPQDE